MQLKGFFVSAALLSSVVSFAQKEMPEIKAPAHVIRTGNVIPAPVSTGKKIAGIMPVRPPAAGPFTGVPLAGQKDYFGAMTDYVNGYVRQYLGAHNRTLSTVEGRGRNKFSLIENVLKRLEVPNELKYLAVIESALNNNAVSPVGAVGPWQLMESTARMMGLRVDARRDDRRDWLKSTQAAGKYLVRLHDQLNDWLLVVAAYNSGPTPVLRAIDKTGSHSFWDIKKYLPRETQGHVLAFVATASIFEKMRPYIAAGELPDNFRFGNEEATSLKDAVAPPKPQFAKEELERMAIVRINEPVVLELMADELGMDKKELRKWNADYDLFADGNWNEDFYRLRIPKDKLDGFVEKKDLLMRKSREYLSSL